MTSTEVEAPRPTGPTPPTTPPLPPYPYWDIVGRCLVIKVRDGLDANIREYALESKANVVSTGQDVSHQPPPPGWETRELLDLKNTPLRSHLHLGFFRMI